MKHPMVSPVRAAGQSLVNLVGSLIWLTALFSGALGFSGALKAQTDDPTPNNAQITVFSPTPGRTVSGVVNFWADVSSQSNITLVIFRVDGREVARFNEAPFESKVDLGPENREHTFEVVVRGNDGELARRITTTPPIRVDEALDLELRQLYVTVQRSGARVAGLKMDDFEILDDGQQQRAVTFEGGDAPITAVLLVDASVSMRGKPLEAAVAGARAFMSRLRDLDEASLVLFSDRTLLESRFLQASNITDQTFSEARAEGGTALNDHLYKAMEILESRQGRRVVILLTDGIDVHSSLDAEAARRMMQTGQSLVYWIEVTTDEDVGRDTVGAISVWRDRDEHDLEFQTLARLVKESGGRRLALTDPEKAPELFEEVLRELREQYVLGYYPSDNRDDGNWHKVEVKSRGRGLQLRTRAGYWDVP